MSDVVIRVENVSKQYRLGKIGTGTLKHDINRWWHTVRGKEDPYLKIGEENDRTRKGLSEYVWALKDISFDVKQGDVLGIIGKNGAGKSTLLKILSRTTLPTTGSLKIRGRVASLLEVGTGFHPDLTGRENIFLNGAILGMTKAEIKSKFDEIVDFSGVEAYIDTPVKRYSSGMYVRLAFAVAAHLEPEILVVDEVLAVGDNEFQRKALGKMKDVSDKEGRTVICVSHNMDAIMSLTRTTIIFRNGSVFYNGDTEMALQKYFADLNKQDLKSSWVNERIGELPLEFVSATLMNQQTIFSQNEDIIIELEYIVRCTIQDSCVAINLSNTSGMVIFGSFDSDFDYKFFLSKEKGRYNSRVIIPKNLLHKGKYFLRLTHGVPQKQVFQSIENVLVFEVFFRNSENPVFGQKGGLILPKLLWETQWS